MRLSSKDCTNIYITAHLRLPEWSKCASISFTNKTHTRKSAEITVLTSEVNNCPQIYLRSKHRKLKREKKKGKAKQRHKIKEKQTIEELRDLDEVPSAIFLLINGWPEIDGNHNREWPPSMAHGHAMLSRQNERSAIVYKINNKRGWKEKKRRIPAIHVRWSFRTELDKARRKSHAWLKIRVTALSDVNYECFLRAYQRLIRFSDGKQITFLFFFFSLPSRVVVVP